MSHGGDIHRILRTRDSDVELIDFSASINPLGPSPNAVRAIKASLELSTHYPDPTAYDMTRAIARRHAIEPSRIVCGNGSTELIFLILRALKPKTVLIAEPAFSEYSHAATLAGARIKRIAAARKDGFLPDPDKFISAMKGVALAFLCNPANPTGTRLGRDAVLDIISAAKKAKCVLVVDEAFMDFCPQGSVIGHQNPYLIVLRSLTKFYALAGLRVGFGVFPKPSLDKIMKHKEPWSINTPAQHAAAASLDDTAYAARTLKYIAAEKAYLEAEFRRLSITFYPSAVNYYLLEIDEARRVLAELAARGLIVRDCSDFKGLDHRHIRVAVRTRRENSLLLSALGQALGKEDYGCRS